MAKEMAKPLGEFMEALEREHKVQQVREFAMDLLAYEDEHAAGPETSSLRAVARDLLTIVGCPTCSWPRRETVGLVCQTCGTDYGLPRTVPVTTATDERVEVCAICKQPATWSSVTETADGTPEFGKQRRDVPSAVVETWQPCGHTRRTDW